MQSLPQYQGILFQQPTPESFGTNNMLQVPQNHHVAMSQSNKSPSRKQKLSIRQSSKSPAAGVNTNYFSQAYVPVEDLMSHQGQIMHMIELNHRNQKQVTGEFARNSIDFKKSSPLKSSSSIGYKYQRPQQHLSSFHNASSDPSINKNEFERENEPPMQLSAKKTSSVTNPQFNPYQTIGVKPVQQTLSTQYRVSDYIVDKNSV